MRLRCRAFNLIHAPDIFQLCIRRRIVKFRMIALLLFHRSNSAAITLMLPRIATTSEIVCPSISFPNGL